MYPALSPSDLHFILHLLFDTYPLYDDRSSRHAVELCLRATINSPRSDELLPLIVRFLKSECLKTSIAHVNAFVLIDWCSVLLQEFATKCEEWTKWGLDIVIADALVLEMCLGLGDTRRAVRIKESALVTTRRALRSLFKLHSFQEEAIPKIISTLTNKSSTSLARNAIFLGVVAGVCARLPQAKPILERQKQVYYTFYIREIIGSRTSLPDHIADGLHDFFESFATLDELRKDVIPPIEKALLRAPEVVLNNLIAPMIRSLPTDLDLSEVLSKNLLKPLVSNIKSTNPTIRAGALVTFESLASRSRDEGTMDKLADEILNPLKQSKVTAADQRVLHAQMLSALHNSAPLSKKIPAGLVGVALKEANEAAIATEVSAICRHLRYGLVHDVPLDKSVSEAFVKGMGDKRIPVRRVWALGVGETLWGFNASQLSQPDVLAFSQFSLGKMVEIWPEVISNPLPAAQSGLVTVAYVLTALIISKFNDVEDPKLSAIKKKVSLRKEVLVAHPKPSFLLNHRVYSKLTAEDDMQWSIRALAAVATELVPGKNEQGVGDAWSQAFIYSITTQGLPPRARQQAIKALSSAYAQQPALIGKAIIDGLWHWYRMVELNDKDTAAAAAKTGTSELYLALQSICLTPEDSKKLSEHFDCKALRSQLIELLVLARPELVPRVSWIDLCLRAGVDPGDLARKHFEKCLKQIIDATTVRIN